MFKGDDWFIGDFGQAGLLHSSHPLRLLVDKVLYSPYAAPELVHNQLVQPEVDVWSLGCILLDVLSYTLYGYEDGYIELRKVRTTHEPGKFVETKYHDRQNGLKPSVKQWIQKIENQHLSNNFISQYLAIVKEMLLPKRDCEIFRSSILAVVLPRGCTASIKRSTTFVTSLGRH